MQNVTFLPIETRKKKLQNVELAWTSVYEIRRPFPKPTENACWAPILRQETNDIAISPSLRFKAMNGFKCLRPWD